MSTDAQRKASAAYHEKREAEGLKKVTLWLSPEARFKLDALKKAAGSKDKAADAAILAWPGSSLAIQEGAADLKVGDLVTSDSQPPMRVISQMPKPRVRVEVPIYERKAFNPQQKPGKQK